MSQKDTFYAPRKKCAPVARRDSAPFKKSSLFLTRGRPLLKREIPLFKRSPLERGTLLKREKEEVKPLLLTRGRPLFVKKRAKRLNPLCRDTSLLRNLFSRV